MIGLAFTAASVALVCLVMTSCAFALGVVLGVSFRGHGSKKREGRKPQ
jgi:hypothetical protein